MSIRSPALVRTMLRLEQVYQGTITLRMRLIMAVYVVHHLRLHQSLRLRLQLPRVR